VTKLRKISLRRKRNLGKTPGYLRKKWHNTRYLGTKVHVGSKIQLGINFGGSLQQKKHNQRKNQRYFPHLIQVQKCSTSLYIEDKGDKAKPWRIGSGV